MTRPLTEWRTSIQRPVRSARTVQPKPGVRLGGGEGGERVVGGEADCLFYTRESPVFVSHGHNKSRTQHQDGLSLAQNLQIMNSVQFDAKEIV